MRNFGMLSAGIRTINKGILFFLFICGLKETKKTNFLTIVTQKPLETRKSLQQVQADIHQKEKQIQGLRVHRDQLEERGSRDATTLSEVIVLCERILTQTRNDAVDLKNYLESGAHSMKYVRGIFESCLGLFLI